MGRAWRPASQKEHRERRQGRYRTKALVPRMSEFWKGRRELDRQLHIIRSVGEPGDGSWEVQQRPRFVRCDELSHCHGQVGDQLRTHRLM